MDGGGSRQYRCFGGCRNSTLKDVQGRTSFNRGFDEQAKNIKEWKIEAL